MAFKASLISLTKGLGTQTAQNIATLNYLASLSTPITETVMRDELKAGQFDDFDDDDWTSLMQQLASISWEDGSLTAAERSVVNTIYEAAAPSPTGACCGAVAPDATNTSMAMSARTGSPTWQHSIDVKLNTDVDCNVHSIEIVLAGGPPVTDPVTAIAYFHKCAANGRHFLYLWTSYATDPAGVSYTPTLTLKDADGNVIASFALGAIIL